MTDKFIIESFWQQGANCVALSFIKAMLLTYGFRKSFSKRKIGKGTLVVLRDESSLFLSRKDMHQLNEGHKIYFRKYKIRKQARDARKIKEFVELAFAIFVRRLQSRKYDGTEYTPSHAIKALTKEGMTTERFHLFAGVKRKPSKKLFKKDLKKISKKKAVLLYNKGHIVCVSHGYYNEDTDMVKISDRIPVLNGRKARAWFELK